MTNCCVVQTLQTLAMRVPKHMGLIVSIVALLLCTVLCHCWIVHAVQLVCWALVALYAADFALCQWQTSCCGAVGHDQKQQSTVTNQFALITGASQGIGKEMAFLLGERHFNLVLAARSELLLQELQRSIEQKHKVQVLTCVCDLAHDAGIDKLLAFVQDQKLSIELLINNVGASLSGAMVDLPHDRVDQLLTLNLVTMTRLCHRIVPQMIQRKSGKVLNMSSIAASSPTPLAAIYGASKAYVSSFSLALNYELRNSGVTVTCFCPGPVASQFGSSAGCEQALYLNVPGATNSAHQAAKDAIHSLLEGEMITFDTPISRVIGLVLQHVLPWRLELMIAYLSMTDPREWFAKPKAPADSYKKTK